MQADIIVIGGGAAGLMAAYGAASSLVGAGSDARVLLLEKMPRPGRKIMITGKGRCNFTNVKDWNAFSAHIRTNPNFVKPAFFNLTPEKLMAFFDSVGMPSVVERGDRAFPSSYHSTDVIDALVRACHGAGVKIETDAEVAQVAAGAAGAGFCVALSDGRSFNCSKLVIATGGLSYPGTGSTGDGYRFAGSAGHSVTPLFPSLTALVPRGYKHSPLDNQSLTENRLVQPYQTNSGNSDAAKTPRHIDRSAPLSELGQKLQGVHLKNTGVQLMIEDTVAGSEFGDIDFTDGGIEGPVGFQLSRKAVKALLNGSRVKLILDLKSGIPLPELTAKVKELWSQIEKDPRSRGVREKEKCRILLGKLMPWEMIPGFIACNPGIMTLERKGRSDTKLWVNLPTIARCMKEWAFEIEGFVGYERAVVTAGGVSTDEILAKTLESRLVSGLHFCGEVLDIDCDTGGYNLHCAFATGLLAGQSAAKSLLKG